MSETNRVQRWRDAKRQAGKKGVMVWLDAAEELRLKDAALTWHCSPSEMMQRAWSAFQPGQPLGISNPTDTLQIRQLIREELAAMQDTHQPLEISHDNNKKDIMTYCEESPVTDTCNSNVTDTHASDTKCEASDIEGTQRPAIQDEPAHVSDTEGTPGQPAVAGSPQPKRRRDALPEATLQAIADERATCQGLPLAAFAQRLRDKGIYRAKTATGIASVSSVFRWLAQAEKAGMLAQ